MRKAAGGADPAGEHHQRWRPVGLAGAGENLLPLRFGAAEHRRDEILHLIGRLLGRLRIGRRLGLLRLAAAAEAGQDFGAADQVERIDAESPADDDQHQNGDDADAAAAPNRPAAASLPSPVLDPVTARQPIKTHDRCLR